MKRAKVHSEIVILVSKDKTTVSHVRTQAVCALHIITSRILSGHRFPIKKYLLMAGSTVFEDMLHGGNQVTGGGDGRVDLPDEGTEASASAEIHLEESAAVLEFLLPYFRNELVDLLELFHPAQQNKRQENVMGLPLFHNVLRMYDKYKVSRAIEACATLIKTECEACTTGDTETNLTGYVFACHFGLPRLAKASGQIFGEQTIPIRPYFVQPSIFEKVQEIENLSGLSISNLHIIDLLKWTTSRERKITSIVTQAFQGFRDWSFYTWRCGDYDDSDLPHPCGIGEWWGLVPLMRLCHHEDLFEIIGQMGTVVDGKWCKECSQKSVSLLEDCQRSIQDLPPFSPDPELFRQPDKSLL
ncbi:hypothetical protein T439DRAFT_325221 [Meredithblackwellia eburnea MCA 4105]